MRSCTNIRAVSLESALAIGLVDTHTATQLRYLVRALPCTKRTKHYLLPVVIGAGTAAGTVTEAAATFDREPGTRKGGQGSVSARYGNAAAVPLAAARSRARPRRYRSQDEPLTVHGAGGYEGRWVAREREGLERSRALKS